MRHPFLIAWMLSALAWGVAGATMVTNQEAEFQLSAWSPPKLLQVASPNGYEAIFSRSGKLRISERGRTYAFDVVRLYDPTHREMWLGPKYEFYAIMGHKIWGVRTQYGQIQIKHSIPCPAEVPNEAAELAAYVGSIRDYIVVFLRDRETCVFRGEHIFGIHKAYISNSAMLSDDGFHVTGVEEVAEGLQVSLRCKYLNYPLTFTFNANQDIVRLAHGTRSIPPVSNPFKASSQDPFAFYRINTIDTDHGGVMALMGHREYAVGPPQKGSLRASVPVLRMGFTINAATGRLLFCPDRCVVVDLGGTLYGLEVRDQAILFYWRQNTLLPFGEHAFAACQEQCRAWEAALAKNHYDIQPDATLRLPEILASDKRFKDTYTYNLGAITVTNGNFLASIYCDANLTRTEVVISPEMKVVSAAVKTNH